MLNEKPKSPFNQDITLKVKKPLIIGVIAGLLLLGFVVGGYLGPGIYQGAKQAYNNFNFSKIKILKESFPFLFGSPPQGQNQPTNQLPVSQPPVQPYTALTNQEQAVIEVVKKSSPAVVSIVISKEVPLYGLNVEPQTPDGSPFNFRIEIPNLEQKGTKKQEVGGGTGFIVSGDGLVLTNRHVVDDEKAEYSVLTNEGKKYEVKVLAKDPFQDLALLRLEKKDKNETFPILPLGDSDSIQIGQTVVAIGNALAELQNTVSVGVISGTSRTITAEDNGLAETMDDILQTDAAINKGNSGGPLLNLKGEVIGINVAIAEQAQSIGFAIPVNKAKRDIEQVKQSGKIVYPFLGVRYILITPEIEEEAELSVDEGALIASGRGVGEVAIFPDSPAEKAGLKEGDIILEANGIKINKENPLQKIVHSKKPGDKITFKVLRDENELFIEAILGEKSSE